MKKKVIIIAATIALIAFLVLFLAPYIVFNSGSKSIIAEYEKIDAYTPPGEEFYKACNLLNFSSHFPGFAERSKNMLSHYSLSVYGAYFSACLDIKFQAQQVGKDFYYEEFDNHTTDIWEDGTMSEDLYEYLYDELKNKLAKVDKSEWITFVDDNTVHKFCNSWSEFLQYFEFSKDDICEICINVVE